MLLRYLLVLLVVAQLARIHARDGDATRVLEDVIAGRLEQAHADGLKLSSRLTPRRDAQGELTAIAFHMGHDASIAVSIGGRVQCVLELERLFLVRYYETPFKNQDLLVQHWRKAIRVLRDRCECESGDFPRQFDVGIYVPYKWNEEAFVSVVHIFEEVFPIDRWLRVDHHESHARLGFFASPFKSALVVSMDAGGNDGYLNAYSGSLGEVARLARLDYNLGTAYNLMASLVPEVTAFSLDRICQSFAATGSNTFSPEQDDSWAGKMMGYAAITSPRADLVDPIVDVFLQSRRVAEGLDASGWTVPPKLLETACAGVGGQQAIAATTQLVFQTMVRDIVTRLLPHAGGRQRLDGIVLTGGCSLNVLANQVVEDSIGLPIFVPPGSNDGGIAVGALWAFRPPPALAPLQYIGFRLWDLDVLEDRARERGAVKISGPKDLANILAGSRNAQGDRPIVALVRGRQEFGPRALGHRSLLVVPDSEKARVRLNRLKHREWYRPVAPMIAVEALNQVFGQPALSPYMEKAPIVVEDTRRRFPALAHLDRTARLQSVSGRDEPWLHALLMAVGEWTGLAALINTSFNTKGAPIVNHIKICLDMLDELPDLDMVVIEDWVFTKSRP